MALFIESSKNNLCHYLISKEKHPPNIICMLNPAGIIFDK